MTDFPEDRLLGNAESLGPILRERSHEIEKARRLPEDISRKLAAAGFYRMGVPSAVGGLECSPLVANRVIERLARFDASCAWVSFIAATAGASLAAIPLSSARSIFASPETMITGVFAPNGRAQKAAGGYKVSGRWAWGSGSQNADWVLGGCLFEDAGKPLTDANGHPLNHMVLMPSSALTFHDTWEVSGLEGTGSLDYEAREVFVPEDHVVGLDESIEPLRALYAFPNFTFLALGIGAVCLGIARASIEELVALAASKKRVGARRTVAEQPLAQVQLAQAEADLRAARAFYYEALSAAWAAAQANAAVTTAQRADMRLATNHATAVAVRVVERMYELGGGSAVYRGSPLQRQFRDIHVAKSHIMVAAAQWETLGRLEFGLPTNTSRL